MSLADAFRQALLDVSAECGRKRRTTRAGASRASGTPRGLGASGFWQMRKLSAASARPSRLRSSIRTGPSRSTRPPSTPRNGG